MVEHDCLCRLGYESIESGESTLAGEFTLAGELTLLADATLAGESTLAWLVFAGGLATFAAGLDAFLAGATTLGESTLPVLFASGTAAGACRTTVASTLRVSTEGFGTACSSIAAGVGAVGSPACTSATEPNPAPTTSPLTSAIVQVGLLGEPGLNCLVVFIVTPLEFADVDIWSYLDYASRT